MTHASQPLNFDKENSITHARLRMNRLPAAAVYLTLLLVFLASIVIDCRNVAGSGSIDLRNRVTGYRLMADGRDAYHYKWQRGDPEKYCDPFNNAAVTVSKTTVTPTLLVLHQPVAALSYSSGRLVWLCFQWVFLLATVAAGWWMIGPGTARWWWAAAVAAFTFGAAWRLHAERGQSYIVLVAILAWWLALTRRARPGNALSAGVLAGVLVALRPPMLLLVPFLAWRQCRQLPGLAIGLALGIGLPMLLHPPCWQEYAAGMNTWSEHYRNGVNPRPPPQAFPPEVEGLPIDTLGRFVRIPFADTSIFALLRWQGIAPVGALPPLLVLLALCGTWAWLARRQDDGKILLGVALWMFLADFFLPAYRNNYNDVFGFAALAMAISLRGKPAAAWWLAMVPGWWVLAVMPKPRWLINLPTVTLLALAIAGVAWTLWPAPATTTTGKPDHDVTKPEKSNRRKRPVE